MFNRGFFCGGVCTGSEHIIEFDGASDTSDADDMGVGGEEIKDNACGGGVGPISCMTTLYALLLSSVTL